MSRKYANPPIIEALCEFRFEPSTPWDMTIPGLIYKIIKDEYPHKEQTKTIEVEVRSVKGELEPKIMGSEQMRFSREDKAALIQINTNLISVHHKKPYPTWEVFFPMIKSGFNTYIEVVEPKGINRIGVRYINKITIPSTTFKMEDYFNFIPHLGEGLPQEHGPFFMGVEISYDAPRDVLRLQLTSAEPEEPGSTTLILDLDYVLRDAGQFNIDDVFDWVQTAHDRVESIFEGCITDKLREIFNKQGS